MNLKKTNDILYVIYPIAIPKRSSLTCYAPYVKIDLERHVGMPVSSETWSIVEIDNSNTVVYTGSASQENQVSIMTGEVCMRMDAPYRLIMTDEEGDGWGSKGSDAWLIFSYYNDDLYKNSITYKSGSTEFHTKEVEFKLSIPLNWLILPHSMWYYTDQPQDNNNWLLPTETSYPWKKSKVNEYDYLTSIRYYRYILENVIFSTDDGFELRFQSLYGIAIYANTQMIYHHNLPETSLSPVTYATGFDLDIEWTTLALHSSVFNIINGTLVLGVEVHLPVNITNKVDPFECFLILRTVNNESSSVISKTDGDVKCIPNDNSLQQYDFTCRNSYDHFYQGCYQVEGNQIIANITINFINRSQQWFNGYSIKAHDSGSQTPRGWYIYGSHDNDTYYALQNEYSQSFDRAYERKEYKVMGNHVAWEYIRFKIVDTNSDLYLQINEIEFLMFPQESVLIDISYPQYSYTFYSYEQVYIEPNPISQYIKSFHVTPSFPKLSNLIIDEATGVIHGYHYSLSQIYSVCGLKASKNAVCTNIYIHIIPSCSKSNIWPDTPSNTYISLPCDSIHEGIQTRYCNYNGEWEDIISHCIPITCPQDSSWPITNAGNTASLPCPQGYIGINTRFCYNSGQWGEPVYTCSNEYCSINNEWPATPIMNTAYLSCPQGYTGIIKRTCKDNKIWDTIINTCQLITCPKDDQWPQTNSTITVTLPCEDTNAEGKMTRYCNNEGIWGQIHNDCHLLKCTEDSEFPDTLKGDVAILPCSNTQFYIGNRRRECLDINGEAIWGEIMNYCHLLSPYIYYSIYSIHLNMGISMTPLIPIIFGGNLFSIIISPTLPEGLQLDVSTGIISGTPTSISLPIEYSISLPNPAGIFNTTLTISIGQGSCEQEDYWPVTDAEHTVILPCPNMDLYTGTVERTCLSGLPAYWGNIINNCMEKSPSFSYPNESVEGIKFRAFIPIAPTIMAVSITEMIISPSLPNGLIFDNTTGLIYGTPTTVTDKNYYITMKNEIGSSTSFIHITITSISCSSEHEWPSIPIYQSLILSCDDIHMEGMKKRTCIDGNPPYWSSIENTCKYPNPSIEYTSTLMNVYRNIDFSVIPVINTYNFTSLSITPSLPSGLTFNSITGQISGNSKVISITNHEVILNNGSGSTTIPITINIQHTYCQQDNEWPKSEGGTFVQFNCTNPSYYTGSRIRFCYAGLPGSWGEIDNKCILKSPSILYSNSKYIFYVNVAINPIIPIQFEGRIDSLTVSPSLPSGITLDTTNGIISGNPRFTSLNTYQIIANNIAGISIFNIVIEIHNIYCNGINSFETTAVNLYGYRWCKNGFKGYERSLCVLTYDSITKEPYGEWSNEIDSSACHIYDSADIPSSSMIYVDVPLYSESSNNSYMNDVYIYSSFIIVLSNKLHTEQFIGTRVYILSYEVQNNRTMLINIRIVAPKQYEISIKDCLLEFVNNHEELGFYQQYASYYQNHFHNNNISMKFSLEDVINRLPSDNNNEIYYWSAIIILTIILLCFIFLCIFFYCELQNRPYMLPYSIKPAKKHKISRSSSICSNIELQNALNFSNNSYNSSISNNNNNNSNNNNKNKAIIYFSNT
ncbi:hypothetical protein WA158_001150 [Blastocystis sp. Blastoise]